MAPATVLPPANGTPNSIAAIEGETLTLEECLSIALTRHGDVGAARESLSSARQRIGAARAARIPEVTGTISSNYQAGQVVSGVVPFSDTISTLGTGVALSQNLFNGGRTRAAIRAARASATGQTAGLGTARSSLAFEVASNFTEQLRQERLVEQRTTQVRVSQSQIQQIEARIREGDAARADVASVQVNLSQAQFDLVTAQNALRTAARRLRNSLGLEDGPPLRLVSPDEAAVGDTSNLPALAELLATARELRPDLLSARAGVLSSQAALQSARVEARPNVAATLGYNLDPRQTGDRRLTVGATLLVPIFNRASHANERAAREDLDAAQIRLAQAQKDADIEVANALTDIQGQAERVRNARALVESAQVNLDTAAARYQAGAGITLDVAVAQSQFFQAQTSLTGALFDLELSRVALDRAVGRYAWSDPGQTPPDRAPME